MRVAQGTLLLGLALSIPLPTLARAEESPRHAVELGGELAFARMLAPSPSHANELSRMNGGAAFALGAAYRSPFLFTPFVELAYTPLYASDARTRFANPAGTIRSSSQAWSGVVGLGLDFDRIRFRAGIGLYDFAVDSTLGASTAKASELDMGYLFGFGATLLRRGRFRMGVDLRLGLVTDAETMFMSLGLTTTFDALVWGARPR